MTKNMLIRISKITITIACAFVVWIAVIGPALAADHHAGNDRHAAGRDDDRSRGRNHYAPAHPDYYYEPPVNYYSAPEPDYYYPPQEEYPVPPPPSQGVNLFFGL